MPHVIIKLYPGRSEDQKKRLAEQITEDMVSIIKCDEKSISIDFEEVNPDQWVEKVYKPEIMKNMDKLYKKPGYDPLS